MHTVYPVGNSSILYICCTYYCDEWCLIFMQNCNPVLQNYNGMLIILSRSEKHLSPSCEKLWFSLLLNLLQVHADKQTSHLCSLLYSCPNRCLNCSSFRSFLVRLHRSASLLLPQAESVKTFDLTVVANDRCPFSHHTDCVSKTEREKEQKKEKEKEPELVEKGRDIFWAHRRLLFGWDAFMRRPQMMGWWGERLFSSG